MRRLDNIDLRLLRVFVVLVDANGFSEAQITLNLSQSTLSTHLAELEKRVGAKLCLRGRHKFRLTDVGQATYDAARKLFADIDDFQSRISAVSRGITGRLKVGAPEGVFTSPHLGMRKIIARLMKPDFDIFVDLVLGTPSELEQRLADGDRDIVLGPLTQKIDGIVYRPYYNEPHYLYCGKGHPLFTRRDATITQEVIDATRFSVRGYRQFDDLFRVGHPRAAASIMQMEAQLMMILSGHFIGFLPDHYADRWVKDGMMRAIKPRTYTFRSLHNIAFRKSDAERPVIRAFLECLPKSALQ
ncbi:LysR family transcriptional regulator [Aestuariivirga sp.]|uniref:LysR family transcriptional regulator n=1 Tax=Aestuariivirga sp. TaxID=2650926 RepID=UPI0039E639BE